MRGSQLGGQLCEAGEGFPTLGCPGEGGSGHYCPALALPQALGFASGPASLQDRVVLGSSSALVAPRRPWRSQLLMSPDSGETRWWRCPLDACTVSVLVLFLLSQTSSLGCLRETGKVSNNVKTPDSLHLIHSLPGPVCRLVPSLSQRLVFACSSPPAGT